MRVIMCQGGKNDTIGALEGMSLDPSAMAVLHAIFKRLARFSFAKSTGLQYIVKQ